MSYSPDPKGPVFSPGRGLCGQGWDTNGVRAWVGNAYERANSLRVGDHLKRAGAKL
uniref:Uncharacterized protein n=1 Tax=mine drainage metagenome TaxID=410659 RepID=E6PJY3_9ZZZZ